ncbi:MAG: hypothetical protein JO014_13550 [Metakosakonia sp.]|nr:hypothetical protein [Phytobacter sp.]MBV8873733.1 hypothetical protein [Phytobacter sp.]
MRPDALTPAISHEEREKTVARIGQSRRHPGIIPGGASAYRGYDKRDI